MAVEDASESVVHELNIRNVKKTADKNVIVFIERFLLNDILI
jgi:hypothetical protein